MSTMNATARVGQAKLLARRRAKATSIDQFMKLERLCDDLQDSVYKTSDLMEKVSNEIDDVDALCLTKSMGPKEKRAVEVLRRFRKMLKLRYRGLRREERAAQKATDRAEDRLMKLDRRLHSGQRKGRARGR